MDRKQALEQALKVARAEEAVAREAEARAWDVLRDVQVQERQKMEDGLAPLREEVHATYLDRNTKLQRTQAIFYVSILADADLRILPNLENSTASMVATLIEYGLVWMDHKQGKYTRTPFGDRVLAVLREFPLEKVQA